MSGVAPILKHRTLAIARVLTPIDTGNLRYNATKLVKVKSNSWTINYSSADAYYVEILEDGTLDGKKTSRAPRKFIERTALEITSYLKNTLEGKPTPKWSKQRFNDTRDNDWNNNMERKERNRQSLFETKYKLGKTKWR
jgi:hypothetical protein